MMTKAKNLQSPATALLEINGHRLQYQILYSKRKTIQMILKTADLLVIKAPCDLDRGVIVQMICKRRKWLGKHIASLKARPYAETPRFEDGCTHFFLGRPHRLCLQAASAKRFSYAPGRFLVSVPPAEPGAAAKLLYKFYTSEAKVFFKQRLDALWPEFRRFLTTLDPAGNWAQHPCPSLAVRRMKSRFGSMTAQGRMTLNTELIRVSVRHIDYVITHELCHLKHMHHGKDFYVLLEQMSPRWPELKQELLRLLPLH